MAWRPKRGEASLGEARTNLRDLEEAAARAALRGGAGVVASATFSFPGRTRVWQDSVRAHVEQEAAAVAEKLSKAHGEAATPVLGLSRAAGHRDVEMLLCAYDADYLGKRRADQLASARKRLPPGQVVPLLRNEAYEALVKKKVAEKLSGIPAGTPKADALPLAKKALEEAAAESAWVVKRDARAEVSRNYNAEILEHLRLQDSPSDRMYKKLVEVMDERTGKDSVILNGQVVLVDHPFEDWWFGGTYDHPPNRYNDRATIVPWRSSYGPPPAVQRPPNSPILPRDRLLPRVMPPKPPSPTPVPAQPKPTTPAVPARPSPARLPLPPAQTVEEALERVAAIKPFIWRLAKTADTDAWGGKGAISAEDVFFRKIARVNFPFSTSESKAVVTTVKAQDLIPSQPDLYRSQLEKYIKQPGGDLPIVIRGLDGRLHAIEHHRLAAQIISGQSEVRVRLLQYTGDPNNMFTSPSDDFVPRSHKKGYEKTNFDVSPQAISTASKILGRQVTEVDLADMVGGHVYSPHLVKIQSSGNAVTIRIRGELGSTVRKLSEGANGPLISNETSTIFVQGQGTATRALAAQVEKARELGVKKIEVFAQRATGTGVAAQHEINSYKIWPKLGFEAPLEGDVLIKAKRQFGPRLPPRPTTADLFSLGQEGVDWWSENGEEIWGEFDLSDGSRSMSTLKKYLREKGISETHSEIPTVGPEPTSVWVPR